MTSNENYFQYDEYYNSPNSNVFVPPRAINFDLQLERDKDVKCPLPSFM